MARWAARNPDWEWDDDEIIPEQRSPPRGTRLDDDEPVAPIVAGLWLPNPELRRGWEFYRVERQGNGAPSPGALPPLGFRGRR